MPACPRSQSEGLQQLNQSACTEAGSFFLPSCRDIVPRRHCNQMSPWVRSLVTKRVSRESLIRLSRRCCCSMGFSSLLAWPLAIRSSCIFSWLTFNGRHRQPPASSQQGRSVPTRRKESLAPSAADLNRLMRGAAAGSPSRICRSRAFAPYPNPLTLTRLRAVLLRWRSEDMLSSFRWGQDTKAPKQQCP